MVPLAAPIAYADDGVTADDNSPSAKEYAIPLDEARSNAAGGSSRSGSGGAPEPFGQGVTTPERSASGKPARKSTKKDRTSGKVRTTTEPSSSVSADADPTPAVAAATAGGDGSSSGQALAGGAALVIVAGGAAGLWARRRRPAGEPG